MTVVLLMDDEPSVTEGAGTARENGGCRGLVEGHADPLTLVEVLAFFVAFPGLFADWNAAECALEDRLRLLGRS